MSRAMSVAVLVVLVGLLGVMSFVLKRAAAPPKQGPPSAEQQAAKDKVAKERMAKDAQDRQKMVRKLTGTEPKLKPGQKPLPENRIPTQPKMPKQPGAMDLNWDWSAKRAPGEAGIDQLQKQDKANGGDPVPMPAAKPKIPDHAGDDHAGHNH